MNAGIDRIAEAVVLFCRYYGSLYMALKYAYIIRVNIDHATADRFLRLWDQNASPAKSKSYRFPSTIEFSDLPLIAKYYISPRGFNPRDLIDTPYLRTAVVHQIIDSILPKIASPSVIRVFWGYYCNRYEADHRIVWIDIPTYRGDYQFHISREAIRYRMLTFVRGYYPTAGGHFYGAHYDDIVAMRDEFRQRDIAIDEDMSHFIGCPFRLVPQLSTARPMVMSGQIRFDVEDIPFIMQETGISSYYNNLFIGENMHLGDTPLKMMKYLDARKDIDHEDHIDEMMGTMGHFRNPTVYNHFMKSREYHGVMPLTLIGAEANSRSCVESVFALVIFYCDGLITMADGLIELPSDR